MNSSGIEKDKKIEDNIIKGVKSLVRLKKKMKYSKAE